MLKRIHLHTVALYIRYFINLNFSIQEELTNISSVESDYPAKEQVLTNGNSGEWHFYAQLSDIFYIL